MPKQKTGPGIQGLLEGEGREPEEPTSDWAAWQGTIHLLPHVQASLPEQRWGSQGLTIPQPRWGQIQSDRWEQAKGLPMRQALSPQRDAATGSAWNLPSAELLPWAGDFCRGHVPR